MSLLLNCPTGVALAGYEASWNTDCSGTNPYSQHIQIGGAEDVNRTVITMPDAKVCHDH